MKVDYYEYIATRNITGGATAEVFASLEQLEDYLMRRHDASLVGITEIGARGEALNWLRFIQEMRQNISKVNAVQVIF